MKVSFFESVFDSSPKVSKDVVHFLDRIKKGSSKDNITELRLQTNKDKRNELKKKLPAVMFNGYFSRPNKQGLKKASGLMVLDFDEDLGTIEKAEEKKEILKGNPSIFSAWVSPNYGVKALLRIHTVVNDTQFKEIFRSAENDFPDLDPSGKDISRRCFESFDPNIYVNLEAEKYIPEVITEAITPIDVGTVTNLPITEENEIANRLIVWFKKKFSTSERNNSIFKLASAFNDFGVSKQTATSYCLNYVQKDFTQDEILKIIKSAYKKTGQFGTKFFEDENKRKRLTNMVVSNRKSKEIYDSFKDIEKEKIDQELENIKENEDLDKFWEVDKRGNIIVNHYRFKLYLQSLNYFKFYPSGNKKTAVFISKDDNFINNIAEQQIKDTILKILEQKDEIEVFNKIAETTKLFTQEYLSMIETVDVEIDKDGKDFSMLYYKNNVLRIFKDKVEIFEYKDIENHIWEDQVIKRDYIEADHHDSMFRSFIWLIAGKEKERYDTMKSVIGYLLHSYKTTATSKAIVLNDEKISDTPNGRSGKSLVSVALSKMKKVSTIDGKNFDPKERFAYQTVEPDSQVLCFDDVKKNFNFENLFSVITTGITLEYKSMGAIKIPVEESPKILISTNYTINSEGDSFTARMFEIELSSYFSANHTPIDEFGCMFFDDWDKNEWARFDQYMINCLQYYLENGLVPYEHKNLETRKFINQTSPEFFEFLREDIENNNGDRIPFNEKFNRNEIKADFENLYQDYKTHKWFNERLFNKWIKSYANFMDVDYDEQPYNGIRYAILRKHED